MKVSIVIPTLNSGHLLEKAVARLRLTAGQGDIEIIVADGGSRDKTLAIARRVADRVVETSSPMRADQMHAGALAATGDLLLFLHPDTRLAGRWLGALRDAWAGEPRPGVTAFRLAYDHDEPVYRALAVIGNRISRWTRMPRGNQALACRRIDYVRAGGFPSVRHLEEHRLLPELAAFGPVVFLDDIVTVSTQPLRSATIYTEIREVSIHLLFKMGIPTEELVKLYQWTA